MYRMMRKIKIKATMNMKTKLVKLKNKPYYEHKKDE